MTLPRLKIPPTKNVDTVQQVKSRIKEKGKKNKNKNLCTNASLTATRSSIELWPTRLEANDLRGGKAYETG